MNIYKFDFNKDNIHSEHEYFILKAFENNMTELEYEKNIHSETDYNTFVICSEETFKAIVEELLEVEKMDFDIHDKEIEAQMDATDDMDEYDRLYKIYENKINNGEIVIPEPKRFFESKNITDEVFNNIDKYVNIENVYSDSNVLKEFYDKTFDKNAILDKVLEFGMETLNEYDKKILLS